MAKTANWAMLLVVGRLSSGRTCALASDATRILLRCHFKWDTIVKYCKYLYHISIIDIIDMILMYRPSRTFSDRILFRSRLLSQVWGGRGDAPSSALRRQYGWCIAKQRVAVGKCENKLLKFSVLYCFIVYNCCCFLDSILGFSGKAIYMYSKPIDQ